jgi:hypothetical protein
MLPKIKNTTTTNANKEMNPVINPTKKLPFLPIILNLYYHLI